MNVKEEYKTTKSNLEHRVLVNNALQVLHGEEIKTILDAGSGRTSITVLNKLFPDIVVDGVIYPGDIRKRKTIYACCDMNKFKLSEVDICEDVISKDYDLVLAHLLLGEATKFANNTFPRLVSSLFNISFKYIIIADYKEDPDVDFDALEKYCNFKNFEILDKRIQPVKKSQKFEKFTSENLVTYTIRKWVRR